MALGSVGVFVCGLLHSGSRLRWRSCPGKSWLWINERCSVSLSRGARHELGVAKGLLPYHGLGSGIKRALDAWPRISFTDDHDGCLFTATVHRQPASELKLAHGSARGSVETPVKTPAVGSGKGSGKSSGKILSLLRENGHQGTRGHTLHDQLSSSFLRSGEFTFGIA